MVNNPTNINKTNKHLSSQLTERKKTATSDVGIPGPGLGQVQKYGGVKSEYSHRVLFLLCILSAKVIRKSTNYVANELPTYVN